MKSSGSQLQGICRTEGFYLSIEIPQARGYNPHFMNPSDVLKRLAELFTGLLNQSIEGKNGQGLASTLATFLADQGGKAHEAVA
jgi:hypothetical protein